MTGDKPNYVGANNYGYQNSSGSKRTITDVLDETYLFPLLALLHAKHKLENDSKIIPWIAFQPRCEENLIVEFLKSSLSYLNIKNRIHKFAIKRRNILEKQLQ